MLSLLVFRLRSITLVHLKLSPSARWVSFEFIFSHQLPFALLFSTDSAHSHVTGDPLPGSLDLKPWMHYQYGTFNKQTNYISSRPSPSSNGLLTSLTWFSRWMGTRVRAIRVWRRRSKGVPVQCPSKSLRPPTRAHSSSLSTPKVGDVRGRNFIGNFSIFSTHAR